MQVSGQATRIDLRRFGTPQMRAFHMSWFAFFLSFFAWFGIAPLMAIVRDDLGLTREQIGNTIIASVAITVLTRLVIGPLCDRIGPRRTYAGLLTLGSLPVMGIGFAHSYESFLLFRLAIGAIGASFVITQYHTSVMFAPNCVGTANATTAGWGNMGGGITQMVMPLLCAGLVAAFGLSDAIGWRVAMVVPGVLLFATGIAYFFLTQDAPEGNYDELRALGKIPQRERSGGLASFLEVAKDPRIWALFVIYGGCFGVELTINNIAALYYHDRFELTVRTAGLIAGLYGLMNLFARTLGGALSDRIATRAGLRGRALLLGGVLLLEGLALMLFSRMDQLGFAIASMLLFGLFVQMSSGATFGLVPFINRRALGTVAGIVGAGGNAGAVLAGFLFRSEAVAVHEALLYMGAAVVVISGLTLTIRFSEETEATERSAFETALVEREELAQAA